MSFYLTLTNTIDYKLILIQIHDLLFIPVGSCIFHIVLDVDVLEAFADGSGGLVSGQDALASHADPLGSLNQFLFEMVLA